jgi:hypothetical protein
MTVRQNDAGLARYLESVPENAVARQRFFCWLAKWD